MKVFNFNQNSILCIKDFMEVERTLIRESMKNARQEIHTTMDKGNLRTFTYFLYR